MNAGYLKTFNSLWAYWYFSVIPSHAIILNHLAEISREIEESEINCLINCQRRISKY